MLFESEPRVVVRGDVTIEAVTADELVDAAIVAAASADRVELCGGIAAPDVAAVVGAVGDAAEVRANRYAFESLAAIAEYARRFGGGEPTVELFAYRSAESSLVDDGGLLVAAVADDDALAEAARVAVAHAAGRPVLVELYGGLGARGAAVVLSATDGAVPVGWVD